MYWIASAGDARARSRTFAAVVLADVGRELPRLRGPWLALARLWEVPGRSRGSGEPLRDLFGVAEEEWRPALVVRGREAREVGECGREPGGELRGVWRDVREALGEPG